MRITRFTLFLYCSIFATPFSYGSIFATFEPSHFSTWLCDNFTGLFFPCKGGGFLKLGLSISKRLSRCVHGNNLRVYFAHLGHNNLLSLWDQIKHFNVRSPFDRVVRNRCSISTPIRTTSVFYRTTLERVELKALEVIKQKLI
jgi:hypothetical protein